MSNKLWCVQNPGSCQEVRCDVCPNRDKIYPKRGLPTMQTQRNTKPETTLPDWLFDTTRIGGVINVKNPDSVNHPPHYSRWKMEPVEFIAINNLPWWLANVIKYTMRYDAKDGLQDLYKARSYLDMQIGNLEGNKRFWEKPVTAERTAKLGARS